MSEKEGLREILERARNAGNGDIMSQHTTYHEAIDPKKSVLTRVKFPTLDSYEKFYSELPSNIAQQLDLDKPGEVMINLDGSVDISYSLSET